VGLGEGGTSGLAEGIGALKLGRVGVCALRGVGASANEESLRQAFNTRVVESVANPRSRN
jgi:hypothetical protein